MSVNYSHGLLVAGPVGRFDFVEPLSLKRKKVSNVGVSAHLRLFLLFKIKIIVCDHSRRTWFDLTASLLGLISGSTSCNPTRQRKNTCCDIVLLLIKQSEFKNGDLGKKMAI